MTSNNRFYTTKELAQILKVSSRTLSRRRYDRRNPLPKPKIQRAGSANLYCVIEIEAYIEKAMQLSQDQIVRYFHSADNVID